MTRTWLAIALLSSYCPCSSLRAAAAVAEAQLIAWNDPAHIHYFNYQRYLIQAKLYGETEETWNKLNAEERRRKVNEGELFLKEKLKTAMVAAQLDPGSANLLKTVWGEQIDQAIQRVLVARNTGDSAQIDRALAQVHAVSRALDYGILYGSAGASLNGLDGNADVTTASMGSASVRLDNVISLLGDVYATNPPALDYLGLVNSAVWTQMNELKDGEGQYVLAAPGATPPMFSNVRWEVSNIVPTAAATSLTDLWLLPGGGRGILVAYLSETEILVSESASSSGRSAFTRDEVWVRAVIYADVAAEKPAWVGKLNNILV